MNCEAWIFEKPESGRREDEGTGVRGDRCCTGGSFPVLLASLLTGQSQATPSAGPATHLQSTVSHGLSSHTLSTWVTELPYVLKAPRTFPFSSRSPN